jgi:hypothetical protein
MPLARDTGVPTQVIQSLSIVYQSATPALAGQLVDWAGNLVINPASGSPAIMGVLQDDATQGKTVSVAMAGVAEVISGGPIAIGNIIGTDVTGKGVFTGLNTLLIGRAMSATTAANQKFQMYITREGTY